MKRETAKAALQKAGREQSYWLQRSGDAHKGRCSNYNNGEGHEYLNEWQLYYLWYQRKGDKGSEKPPPDGHTS